ncbi:neuropeptide CCHamide-2 receptor [Euwallacea similis]|uniref:neuropeptide CCHamide-2 receptor n=1 Tax=Euwallacea similis TaxID=1736056 RepID=UPI00344C52C4
MNCNITSFTSTEGGYTPYKNRPETYIVPVLFLLIFIVGIVGNGTLVAIFMRHHEMRSIPNTYIFSLAVADLLVLLTCVPFTSIVYTVEYWPWGVAVCKISEWAKDVSVGVSVFTLTALSAERYSIIVNPLKRIQMRPLTVVNALIIWILAISLAVPTAIFSRIMPIEILGNQTIRVCYPFPDIKNYDKYSVIIRALMYYVIPLITISTFYIMMAIRLHSSANSRLSEIVSTQGTAQTKSRKHVARMVLIFVLLFFVCFLPQNVFILWFNFEPCASLIFNDMWAGIKIVGFCLSYFHSCVNPVALYFISQAFREHFNAYLFCRPKIRSASLRTSARRSTGSFSNFSKTQ